MHKVVVTQWVMAVIRWAAIPTYHGIQTMTDWYSSNGPKVCKGKIPPLLVQYSKQYSMKPQQAGFIA